MFTVTRFTALALFSTALVYACSATGPDQPLPPGTAGTAGTGGTGGADAGGAAGAGGSVAGSGGVGGTSAGSAGQPAGGEGGSDPGDFDGGLGGTTNLASYPDAGFEYTPSDAGPGTCAAVTGQATLRKKPMDIIISIDNSGSMAGEILAVQQRVNDDFAAIIAASEIDYRVIMVSRYGNVYSQNTSLPYDGAFAVCIGDPLGGSACPANAGAATPALVNDRPRFFHDSVNIGSGNTWCQLINSYDLATASAPSGWQEWLRPEAFKVFIAITDDSPRFNSGGTNGQCPTSANLTDNLAGAQQFDTLLRGLSSTHFGTSDARNYAWYSIVGMAGNDGVNSTPLQPNEAVQNSCCKGDGTSHNCSLGDNTPNADGVRAGAGYQELSRMTGGLRFPSCFNDNFDAMFNAVAQGVIERSSASCEYALPEPEGGTINPANIVATYHPSGGGADVVLSRVSAEDQCGSAQGFYLDDNVNPTRLSLCSQACTLVQADDGATIDIDFGCLGS
jgi:hypothetical protein